ncbi:MAG: NAD-dependent dihydropyrimidine dehydrogenase subunit PreA [Caulobacteraceae bacterium]|nr:NAD-dependent dihydropyrimidine dehydrogenase subunit PreA [Caulobacteraceae bacterium]
MADLSIDFVGIKSPNPFWLASAPPTDKAVNVTRAFEAGWGGVVWKTLGEDPPVVNVNGPRYSTLMSQDRRVIGFNNIELISDRPLRTNLDEILRVKRAWPDRAMVVSLMAPVDEAAWRRLLPMTEDAGADGVELNFGCPHGMSERGMGSTVGQIPEYIQLITEWCKHYSRLPVIVKLTPNITDIRQAARAAHAGGADSVSLINTLNSVMGVDLDRMTMIPSTDGAGSHGGYCGPAVKPIALNMVAEIARDAQTRDLPISGIGGISTWRDAAEFIALGCGSVQVCTAAMVYGFKIVEDLCDGLSNFMDQRGYASIEAFRGGAVQTVKDWNALNLNHVEKAVIDQDHCIQCGRCHVVCEDTSHQAITATRDGRRHFEVREEDCVGCNLCVSICPAPGALAMRALASGEIDRRTGERVSGEYANWSMHPDNPMRVAASAD